MNPELLATFEVISLFEKSKALSDQILDDLPGVFAYIDDGSKILRSNRQLAGILGSSQEDILFRRLDSCFGENERKLFNTTFAKVRSGELAIAEFEIPLKASDGTIRDFLWQINAISVRPAIHATADIPAIFICTGQDISEVKKAQLQVANLAKDLELAEALQNLLLPGESDLQMPLLDVAAYYKSAAVSGGDFWFIEFMEDGRVWIMVGDVTGHGAGAAMVTALVTGCVRTLRSAAKAKTMTVTLPGMLAAIDETLTAIPDQPYWMTMIAIEIMTKTGELKWWAAGSPPAYVVSSDGTINSLSEQSTPLGSGELRLSNGNSMLENGQKLLLLTDGVTETKNDQGQDFDRRGLKKYLASIANQNVFVARDALANELARWRDGRPLEDDITFLVVARKGIV